MTSQQRRILTQWNFDREGIQTRDFVIPTDITSLTIHYSLIRKYLEPAVSPTPKVPIVQKPSPKIIPKEKIIIGKDEPLDRGYTPAEPSEPKIDYTAIKNKPLATPDGVEYEDYKPPSKEEIVIDVGIAGSPTRRTQIEVSRLAQTKPVLEPSPKEGIKSPILETPTETGDIKIGGIGDVIPAGKESERVDYTEAEATLDLSIATESQASPVTIKDEMEGESTIVIKKDVSDILTQTKITQIKDDIAPVNIEETAIVNSPTVHSPTVDAVKETPITGALIEPKQEIKIVEPVDEIQPIPTPEPTQPPAPEPTPVPLPLSIDSPNAVIITEGQSYEILWHPKDPNRSPRNFQIKINNSIVRDLTWAGNDIGFTVSSSNLSIGSNTVECTVYSTNGLSAKNAVIATLNKKIEDIKIIEPTIQPVNIISPTVKVITEDTPTPAKSPTRDIL